MAMLPSKRSASALMAGLAFVGVMLVGLTPWTDCIGSAAASSGIAAFEEPQPPAPDPGPDLQRPADPTPQQAAPAPRRRHVDNDPIFRH